MINILNKLFEKLEDINKNVDKKIASKKLFKGKYEDLDDSVSYAKKMQCCIDTIKSSVADEYDIIKHQFIDINIYRPWVTGPVHESKELLEVFIGKYRKEHDRMDVFNHDE